jgi:hypothetical protein
MVVERVSPADEFLGQKARMTIEVQDGTFMLPVTAAKKSRYGLILFLPMKDDSTTFLPKPGTQMHVTVDAGEGRKTYNVYYPGTHAEVPELESIIMSLVLAEENGEA